MVVLGLNIYGHDTAAAIVKDGELIAAIEEERLSRKKHDRDFPYLAIEYCLKEASLTLNEIDCLAVSKDFDKLFKEKYLQYTLDNYPKANELFLGGIDNIKEITNVENEIRETLQYNGKIKYCLHHVCHISSSYHLSGFEESAVLSVDGLGENDTTVLGHGKNGKITILDSIKFPHSLGMLYQAFTYFLGFTPNSAEGTVMALASFGDENSKNAQGVAYIDIFRDMINLHDDGTFSFNLEYFNYPFTRKGWVSEKTVELLGEKRKNSDEILQKHKDIAAALQKVFEETYVHLAVALQKKTGLKKLSVAGGCALNCVANAKILNETEFDDIYIQPAASDSGTAIGAALNTYRELSKKELNVKRVNTTYLGAAFSDAEIKKVFDDEKIEYVYLENPSIKAAQLLYEGSVVGWFQGKMEFGPRALGNRSILSAPFPLAKKDYVNNEIKHREWFRPFAPSVLKDKAADYFKINCDSPFMLMAFDIVEDKLKDVEAIAHVDNTARIQMVTKETNEKYYELISEFYKLSGVPVVLNTSFNDKGEPIVCSPKDAIKSFYSTGLDYVIIGNYLVKNEKR